MARSEHSVICYPIIVFISTHLQQWRSFVSGVFICISQVGHMNSSVGRTIEWLTGFLFLFSIQTMYEGQQTTSLVALAHTRRFAIPLAQCGKKARKMNV